MRQMSSSHSKRYVVVHYSDQIRPRSRADARAVAREAFPLADVRELVRLADDILVGRLIVARRPALEVDGCDAVTIANLHDLSESIS